MNEYQKTDLSKILKIPNLNENNFNIIFNLFDENVKDYKLVRSQNENEYNNENDFMSEEKKSENDSKKSNNKENSKTIEIFDNGSVEIKNNNDIKNNINEIHIPDFDEEFDNEIINNNKNDKDLLNIPLNDINNNIDYNNNLKKVQIDKSNEINNNKFASQEKKKINYNIKNIINNNHINFEQSQIKENENNVSKKYEKTDISKVLKNNDIFNIDKFNQMIVFLHNKMNQPINNYDNSISPKVKLNLDSGYKQMPDKLMFSIKEEDNESYDSMSLQKSLRSSAKATPNLIESKKKSIQNLKELNISNNLLKTFSKDKSNLNIDNNNFIEENILGEDEKDKINIFNSNTKKKEKKISFIDINLNSGNKSDINYTTPKSKEKTIENIYENANGMNEERNNNEPEAFENIENDELKFSDFNPVLNEEEKEKEEKNDIIILNEVEKINNEPEFNDKIINNNNIKKYNNDFLNYIVTDKINRKIMFLGDDNIYNNKKFSIPLDSYYRILQLSSSIKFSQKKIYERFIKKLKKKVEKYQDNNNVIQNKNIDKIKIHKIINIFQNKLKHLKDCYLYIIAKKSKSNQENETKILIINLDILKKQEDLEKMLDDFLFNIKAKEYKYFNLVEIQNILNNFKTIHKNEISKAKRKNKRNELKYPEYKENIFNKVNNIDKKHNFLSIIFIIILPLILAINLVVNNMKNN